MIVVLSHVSCYMDFEYNQVDEDIIYIP